MYVCMYVCLLVPTEIRHAKCRLNVNLNRSDGVGADDSSRHVGDESSEEEREGANVAHLAVSSSERIPD